jgi:hypothetical protein
MPQCGQFVPAFADENDKLILAPAAGLGPLRSVQVVASPPAGTAAATLRLPAAARTQRMPIEDAPHQASVASHPLITKHVPGTISPCRSCCSQPCHARRIVGIPSQSAACRGVRGRGRCGRRLLILSRSRRVVPIQHVKDCVALASNTIARAMIKNFGTAGRSRRCSHL